ASDDDDDSEDEQNIKIDIYKKIGIVLKVLAIVPYFVNIKKS
ncbi:hypothetical protein E2320_020341, partial [Naja naja]